MIPQVKIELLRRTLVFFRCIKKQKLLCIVELQNLKFRRIDVIKSLRLIYLVTYIVTITV